MGDCISREAAISCVYEGLSYVEVEQKLKALPSVNCWIPCSKSLPGFGRYVLFSFDLSGMSIGELRPGEGSHPEMYWEDMDDIHDYELHEVKAWMELPEQYKEEIE